MVYAAVEREYRVCAGATTSASCVAIAVITRRRRGGGSLDGHPVRQVDAEPPDGRLRGILQLLALEDFAARVRHPPVLVPLAHPGAGHGVDVRRVAGELVEGAQGVGREVAEEGAEGR